MRRILALATLAILVAVVAAASPFAAARQADTAGEKMQMAETRGPEYAAQHTQATPMEAAGRQGQGAKTQPGAAGAKTAALPARKVAITFDDLPAAAAAHMTGAEIDDMTAKLLATLKREKIPAIGFVNEGKLYRFGDVDARIKALQMWLDDGFELGNHTYSHLSLNKAGLQAWEENVIEGEPVLRLLLAQHHMTLRYLRHPYLDAGADLKTRRDSEQFLASRGYTVAPVTMDAWDWAFAPVYADAKKRGDAELANKVVHAYLDYSNAMFEYDETFSKQLIGYEPKQVLLLHGTELEADHFADLAALLRKRGYSFITLDEALTDSAYNLPDNYVGEGTGWLDQWAITQGKMPPNEPPFPAWVQERANALHQPQETMP
ncbi:MAG TPA: polysaccharide deacetylase family protein [Candidatus Acidoferrales bacterium]|nr:polysaccharide deacetylase family protein [Candidatus Acidoferrales bacterium]